MASMRLGDLLVKAKVISDTQLKTALSEQQRWGGKVGEILVRMEVVTEEMLVKALSKQLSVPAVDLEAIASIPAHVRSKLPGDSARALTVLPLQLRDEGRTLVVAMSEPQNLKQLDELRSITRCRIVAQIAGRQAIARAFTRFYDGETEVSESQESSFKVLNSQGNTMIRNTGEIEQQRATRETPRAKSIAEQPRATSLPETPRSESSAQTPRASTLGEVSVPPAAPGRSPQETLRAVEEAQRKEVAALKAMVEVLIDKGVFTREEYLARVKRTGPR